jgi:hypothetical protein
MVGTLRGRVVKFACFVSMSVTACGSPPADEAERVAASGNVDVTALQEPVATSASSGSGTHSSSSPSSASPSSSSPSSSSSSSSSGGSGAPDPPPAPCALWKQSFDVSLIPEYLFSYPVLNYPGNPMLLSNVGTEKIWLADGQLQWSPASVGFTDDEVQFWTDQATFLGATSADPINAISATVPTPNPSGAGYILRTEQFYLSPTGLQVADTTTYNTDALQPDVEYNWWPLGQTGSRYDCNVLLSGSCSNATNVSQTNTIWDGQGIVNMFLATSLGLIQSAGSSSDISVDSAAGALAIYNANCVENYFDPCSTCRGGE